MSTLQKELAPLPCPGKLRVEIVAYIHNEPAVSQSLAEKLSDLLALPAEEFHLSLRPSSVADEENALAALDDDGTAAVVFASPDLLVITPGGEKRIAPLVERLRKASAASRKPLVLLALASPPQTGLIEVDAYLPMMPEIHEITNVGAKLFHRLWLKLPPNHRELGPDNAIRMQVVTKQSEMLQAFRLRYKTYNALGYLPEDDSLNGGLDIDAYDKLSCQFVLIDHREDKVIGTFRLVTNRLPPHSSAHFDRRPAEVFQRQRDITDTIVQNHAGARIKYDYRMDTPLLLPIFRSMDFSERWLSEFSPILGKCCEVSRIVVDPAYRGLNLLALIMRAAAVFAYDFGRSVVLLECAPHHIEMYKKYGYQAIGLHGTVQELDQIAAGLRLDLPGTPHDAHFQMAKRLIGMLLDQPARPYNAEKTRHLCACTLPNCWQNGSYSYRKHVHCPLNDWH